ncbi:MAG: hypothetical protein Q9186_003364 [Xanthomendoza sp. 1 TL-2023]
MNPDNTPRMVNGRLTWPATSDGLPPNGGMPPGYVMTPQGLHTWQPMNPQANNNFNPFGMPESRPPPPPGPYTSSPHPQLGSPYQILFPRDPTAPLGSFENPHPYEGPASSNTAPPAPFQYQHPYHDPTAPLGSFQNPHPYDGPMSLPPSGPETVEGAPNSTTILWVKHGIRPHRQAELLNRPQNTLDLDRRTVASNTKIGKLMDILNIPDYNNTYGFSEIEFMNVAGNSGWVLKNDYHRYGQDSLTVGMLGWDVPSYAGSGNSHVVLCLYDESLDGRN